MIQDLWEAHYCTLGNLTFGVGTKNRCWDGLIDDIRIYGREFTEIERCNYTQPWVVHKTLPLPLLPSMIKPLQKQAH